MGDTVTECGQMNLFVVHEDADGGKPLLVLNLVRRLLLGSAPG
jgi:hypothetical protein